MLRNGLEVIKEQRIACSCAVLVGMFLCAFGHAPVLPVVAGCLVAIGITILRARPAASTRGNR